MLIKGVGTIKRESYNLTNYGFLNDEPFRVTLQMHVCITT